MTTTQSEDKPETVLEDTYLTGLANLDPNVTVSTVPLPSGRIGFKIIGDLSPTLALLTENRPVPIRDYLESLKGIRSLLFTLKREQKGINGGQRG